MKRGSEAWFEDVKYWLELHEYGMRESADYFTARGLRYLNAEGHWTWSRVKYI